MKSECERQKKTNRGFSDWGYSTRQVLAFNGTENINIMGKLEDAANGEGMFKKFVHTLRILIFNVTEIVKITLAFYHHSPSL